MKIPMVSMFGIALFALLSTSAHAQYMSHGTMNRGMASHGMPMQRPMYSHPMQQQYQPRQFHVQEYRPRMEPRVYEQRPQIEQRQTVRERPLIERREIERRNVVVEPRVYRRYGGVQTYGAYGGGGFERPQRRGAQRHAAQFETLSCAA